MITLQFPKLENALAKITKDMKEDDPRRGIIIINGNAIVFQDNFCLAVNLYDYFTLDCDIDDEEELQELKKILFYMDGKTFNKEFWKELTKGANMKMNKGLLFVETPKYAKDLHYKEVPINFLEPLRGLTYAKNLADSLVSKIALPFEALHLIYNCLSADFKGDKMILEFSTEDKPVRFTFKNRKHFYGYLIPDYSASQEGFRFECLNDFVEDEFVSETLQDLEKQQAPPPPEFRPVQNESNQLF
jgi:hypothetical protein